MHVDIATTIEDDATSSKEPIEEDVTVEDVNNKIEQEMKDDGEGNSIVDDVSVCIYSLVISREKAGES